MSVSSHLSPEPERRLWTILDSTRRAVEWTDTKIAALTAFAAAQLIFIKITQPAGFLGALGIASLYAALPLGALAFSPLTTALNWLPFLEPAKGKPNISDCLIAPDDLAKYSHGELINRMDKYLGGGITATPYHEDIVGQIAVHARIAARKQRLFRLACVVVGIGQLGLLGQLLGR